MEIFAILLIIIGTILKLVYPKFKGYVGEEVANRELNKLGDNYKVLNDIMVYSDNKTHQIDHIVVSKYGVYVIEMKNYGGTIKGKEKDDEWIQNIGTKTNKLKNPIKQNHGHILSLKDVTKEKENIFIPIVCFGNNVELKLDVTSKAVLLKNLNKTVKSYREVRIDNIDKVLTKINDANITDKKVRKEHVSNIKKKYK